MRLTSTTLWAKGGSIAATEGNFVVHKGRPVETIARLGLALILTAFASCAFADPPCDITGRYLKCPTCDSAPSHPTVVADAPHGYHYYLKNADNTTMDAFWDNNVKQFKIMGFWNGDAITAVSSPDCTSLIFSDGAIWSR